MINCAASNSSDESSVDVNNSKKNLKNTGLLSGKGGRCLILAIIAELHISVQSIFHFFCGEDGGGGWRRASVLLSLPLVCRANRPRLCRSCLIRVCPCVGARMITFKLIIPHSPAWKGCH